jgi:Zn-dependent protease
MTLQHVDILFQLIVFLFAISVHESAHAWMANRCGDPTARMLGRITLNPIKHIDPIGTVVMPLIALISGFPTIGWAKPTPVDPRNFQNPVLDDILTSVVGPISNFVLATATALALAAIALVIPGARAALHGLMTGFLATDSTWVPLVVLLYELMAINVALGVFNLIPVPPLDGSHVLRHLLPEPMRRVYDMTGIFGLLALVYFGGNLLRHLIHPVMELYISLLLRV